MEYRPAGPDRHGDRTLRPWRDERARSRSRESRVADLHRPTEASVPKHASDELRRSFGRPRHTHLHAFSPASDTPSRPADGRALGSLSDATAGAQLSSRSSAPGDAQARCARRRRGTKARANTLATLQSPQHPDFSSTSSSALHRRRILLDLELDIDLAAAPAADPFTRPNACQGSIWYVLVPLHSYRTRRWSDGIPPSPAASLSLAPAPHMPSRYVPSSTPSARPDCR